MIKYQIYNYSKANNIASLVMQHYMYPTDPCLIIGMTINGKNL